MTFLQKVHGKWKQNIHLFWCKTTPEIHIQEGTLFMKNTYYEKKMHRFQTFYTKINSSFNSVFQELSEGPPAPALHQPVGFRSWGTSSVYRRYWKEWDCIKSPRDKVEQRIQRIQDCFLGLALASLMETGTQQQWESRQWLRSQRKANFQEVLTLKKRLQH